MYVFVYMCWEGRTPFIFPFLEKKLLSLPLGHHSGSWWAGGRDHARDSWTGASGMMCRSSHVPSLGRVPRLLGQWLPPDPRSGALSGPHSFVPVPTSSSASLWKKRL